MHTTQSRKFIPEICLYRTLDIGEYIQKHDYTIIDGKWCQPYRTKEKDFWCVRDGEIWVRCTKRYPEGLMCLACPYYEKVKK